MHTTQPCLHPCTQPCLGGSARTAILATINPSQQHIEETLNTLQFAQRTMNVVNMVVQNRLGSQAKGGSKEQVRLCGADMPKWAEVCRSRPSGQRCVGPAQVGRGV